MQIHCPLALIVVASTSSVAANDLPPYKPEHPVAGTIRNFGASLGGLIKLWEDGFRAWHPQIRFEDKLPTSDAAIPALATGVADLGPDGAEASLTETLAFYEVHGYLVTDLIVASGAFDVEGRSNGPIVFVHKDNPLTQLTLKQLDGIFGAERTGGLRGFQWTPASARGPEGNIRTWGQLGLKGEWADKPIQTYGHAPFGTGRFFQWKVLKGSDEWNPNYREYVETGSKSIADEDKAEQRLGLRKMLKDDLANDRFGIGWSIMPQARGVSGIKPIALAAQEGGPYVTPSRETFQNRTYPLVRNIYIYLNRTPGKPVDPKLKEFLRYVLSRDGQELVVKNGNYLPLTAELAREQVAKVGDIKMESSR
jgi:phosphate transport system substrate-binding protein